MRALILFVILVGCVRQAPPPQPPQKAAPVNLNDSVDKIAKEHPEAAEANLTAASRNFVCERFAVLNPEAVCTAERTTDAVHTARVVLGQQLIACTLLMNGPSIVCSEPIIVQMQPAPPSEPAKPKKKTKR